MKTEIKVPSDKLHAYRDGAVGWIVFDNPERRNAISVDMWNALPVAVAELDGAPDVRAIVLAGAGGKAFVAGADISQFDELRAGEDAVAQYDRIALAANQALDQVGKPVVAMIRGYCIGAGVGLALKCDLRICTEASRFAIPAARLGLGYRQEGIRDLVVAVGAAKAKAILFTARQYSAAEAAAMGLVDDVVADGELEATVAALTERIAENAPLTMRAAKAAINVASRAMLDTGAVDAVDDLIAACFASEDYQEGRRAFVEKRVPVFRGH